MLVAAAPPIHNALTAEESDIALHASSHRPPREIAVRQTLSLTIEYGGSQTFAVKVRSDRWQSFVIDRCHDPMSFRTVIALLQADVINVIIFHASSEQLADGVGERDRARESSARHFDNRFSIHRSFLIGQFDSTSVPFVPDVL